MISLWFLTLLVFLLVASLLIIFTFRYGWECSFLVAIVSFAIFIRIMIWGGNLDHQERIANPQQYPSYPVFADLLDAGGMEDAEYTPDLEIIEPPAVVLDDIRSPVQVLDVTSFP